MFEYDRMIPRISPVSLLLFAIHSLLAVLLQMQNASISTNVTAADVLQFGLAHVAIGLLIVLAYELMSRRRILLLIFYPIYFLILVGLVGNQLFYQIFQDSLTLSHLDEFKVADAGVLSVSMQSEIGRYQILNLVALLCAATTLAFAEKRWRSKYIALVAKRNIAFAAGGAALGTAVLVAALLQSPSEQTRRASSHLLLTLWTGGSADAQAV